MSFNQKLAQLAAKLTAANVGKFLRINSNGDVETVTVDINSRLVKSVAGGASVTLTAEEVKSNILQFTGTLTANVNVIVPNVDATWTVLNRTSGAFTLTLKTASGTGIAVTQGKQQILSCDTVNVFRSNNETDFSVASDEVNDLNVAKILRWKNYGSGHVIFDASAGTSPNGVAVDRNNPAVEWNSQYPSLMGWNGSTTYGVRVDTARIAESAYALNASPGTAPHYACRAWVNFNGTNTVSIRASGNVSSIGDNGVGDYTVNFITGMPTTAYAVSLSLNSPGVTNTTRAITVAGDDASGAALKNGAGVRIITGASSTNSKVDCAEINVSIFC